MNISNSKSIKSGFWYIISNFVVKAMTILSMPIFARIMSKNDIGDFASYTTWISLFAVIITFNLQNSVVIAKIDYSESFSEYISTVSMLSVIITLVCYFCIIPWIDVFAELLQIPIYSVHIMFIYLTVSPALDIRLAKYRVEMRWIPIVVLTIVPSVLVTVISVVGVVYFENDFAARTVGNYIPLTVLCFVMLLCNVFEGRKFKLEYCRYALSICVPLVIHSLAGVLMSSSDRLMIKRLCNSEEVALYSLAYSCALVVNILRNSLIYAWEPWLFEKLKHGEKSVIRNSTGKMIMGFSVICVGIMLVAPEILYIMGGMDYVEAKYVVPPVVMGYLVSFAYSLYGEIERYYKKQCYFAVFASISAITNLILNYCFIPKYGYVAAAYTTLVCFALECFLHYLNVRRMKMLDYVDGRKVSITIVGGGAVALGVNFLYSCDWLRYIIGGVLLVLIICILCVKRKTIILAIKSRRGIQ